jgi:hypothetical protein
LKGRRKQWGGGKFCKICNNFGSCNTSLLLWWNLTYLGSTVKEFPHHFRISLIHLCLCNQSHNNPTNSDKIWHGGSTLNCVKLFWFLFSSDHLTSHFTEGRKYTVMCMFRLYWDFDINLTYGTYAMQCMNCTFFN